MYGLVNYSRVIPAAAGNAKRHCQWWRRECGGGTAQGSSHAGRRGPRQIIGSQKAFRDRHLRRDPPLQRREGELVLDRAVGSTSHATRVMQPDRRRASNKHAALPTGRQRKSPHTSLDPVAGWEWALRTSRARLGGGGVAWVGRCLWFLRRGCATCQCSTGDHDGVEQLGRRRFHGIETRPASRFPSTCPKAGALVQGREMVGLASRNGHRGVDSSARLVTARVRCL
jgi:hypothetical protein